MKLHYLEIISLEVDAICTTYEAAHNVQFGEADELLGGARTCNLTDGSIVGIRGPLRDTEDPIIRPYWLVKNIEKAVSAVEAQGAAIAVPPLEIPGRGIFAIYIKGAVDHGFWQL